MSVLDPPAGTTDPAPDAASPTAASPTGPPRPVRLPAALSHRGWVAVLGIGLALFVLTERAISLTGNVNFVPTGILLGSALVPLTYVVFVRERPLPFGVSAALLAGTTFFGGVIGILLAGTVEDALGLRKTSVGDMFVAGLIEETAKLLVPVVLLIVLHRRLRTVDGLLLGVASGAGFATLETMGYGFSALLGRDGPRIDVLDVLVLRGVVSPAGHMTWTALTTGALVAAVTASRRGPALLRFVGAFALAVGLHGLWDAPVAAPVSGVLHVVVAVVGLGLLTVVVHRLEHRPPRRERRRLRRERRLERRRARSGTG